MPTRFFLVRDKILCHHPPPKGRYLSGRPFFIALIRQPGEKSPKALIVCLGGIIIFSYENSADEIRLTPGSGFSGYCTCGDGCHSAGRQGFFAAVDYCFDRGAFGAYLLMDFDILPRPLPDPPSDKNLLLAPADGRITDIETVEEDNFIGEAAMRIGIFLSIFNTHINRAPCNAKVEKIIYRKGKYKNALNPQSGRVNESNNLGLVRTDSPQQRLFVRQISGAIARRIVCDVNEGQVLTGGEKFGMIKFGSRTELYVPVRENVQCLVRIGDKVKAGLTPLVRYEKLTAENAESAEEDENKRKTKATSSV